MAISTTWSHANSDCIDKVWTAHYNKQTANYILDAPRLQRQASTALCRLGLPVKEPTPRGCLGGAMAPAGFEIQIHTSHVIIVTVPPKAVRGGAERGCLLAWDGESPSQEQGILDPLLEMFDLFRLEVVASGMFQPQSPVTTVNTTPTALTTISIYKSGHSRCNDKCVGTLSYRWFSSLKLPELII